MTAQEKLASEIAALTTEGLIELSMRMVVASSRESTVVAAYAEKELERRMSKKEFADFMGVLDTLLDAAA